MTSNVGFFNGRLGIAKSDPKVAVYINTQDAIKLPSGFTSQRPAGLNVEPGMMRYNTTTGKFEGYSGETGSEAWGSLGDGSGGGGGGGGTSSGATGDTTLQGQTLESVDPNMSGLMTNQTNVVGGGDFEVMGSGTHANLDIIAPAGSANLNLKVGNAASTAATIGWNNTLMDFNKPVKINGDLTLTGNLLESDGVTPRAFSNWSNSGGTATSTITRNSAVDITGTITASTYTSPNADSTHYFGQSKIGKLWSENNIAAFGHRYVTDTIPCYAIFQINTGETAVNSKTGYPLTLRIGNDTKIHIKSDGNVGIGTTSPGARLGIEPAGVGTRIAPNNASHKALSIDDGNNGLYVNLGTSSDGTTAAFGLNWYNSNTHTDVDNALVLSNVNGENRVGIGRTDPTQVLDVKFPDATSGDDPLFIQATRSGLGDAGVGFRAGDGTWQAFWEHTHGSPDRMNFGMYRAGSGKQVYMTLSHEGRLGIGTTSPEAKLHIRGGGNFDGNIRLDMDYGPGAGWGIPTHFNSIEFYTPDNGTPNTGKVAYRLTHQSYDTHANTLLVLKSTIANGDTESDLMTWKHGNVGIGTISPDCVLEVYDNSAAGEVKDILHVKNSGGYDMVSLGTSPNYNSGAITLYQNSTAKDLKSIVIDGNGDTYFTGGNVGIGTASPSEKLEVNGKLLSKKLTVTGENATSNDAGWGGIPVNFNGYGYRNYNHFHGYQYSIHYWTSNNTSLSTASGNTNQNNDANINMRCAHGLETPRVVWYSDKRIKENIVDVSDNMALDMVRKIPCRYYNYIDKITRGTGKVIGFIAQEVREFFPEATRVAPNFIPNCGTLFHKDIIGDDKPYWTDLSNNKFKYTIPNFIDNLTNTDGFKEGVKFQITTGDYDLSINEVFENGSIHIREINIESDLESFIFDKKYSYIDIESMEVQDFHYIDKDKIFTLHHSAIQELDEQQQADKDRISDLETKNSALENKVTTLESTLETVLARLTELENK